MTDSIPDLAAEIASDPSERSLTMRIGMVVELELVGSRRVKLDISGDAWVNRLEDTSLRVGDRVSVLQQGPIMLVIGRLEGSDGFAPIGTIMIHAGWFAPTNWLYCDGSAISRNTYPDLYFQCGVTYGAGNGTTTFNVPNLSNRFPLGESFSHFRGDTGTGSTTLTSSNLPTHNHGVGSATASASGVHAHFGDGGSGSAHFAGVGSEFAADTGVGFTSADGSHFHNLSGFTDNSGSSTPFTAMPPFLAVQFIIRAL